MDRITDPLPPAFFPVSLNVAGRRCLVIGDDREAVEKAAALAECGANVVRVATPADVRDADVIASFFVISTPKNETFSARLRRLADEHRFLLCCIDQPAYGFVAMQAIVKAGPARIAISTGGVAPRVGKVLKDRLQSAMDGTFARFMDCLATQRRRNRMRLASVAERRAAMMSSAEGFEIEVAIRYPAWFKDELSRLGPSVQGERTPTGATP